jgi:ERCC4-type nuclease
MKIICDYREDNVYNCLLKKIETRKNYVNVSIEKTNLNIGDFVIGRYIIERKTLSDLASSILDGRYKEQSSRLDKYIQEHVEDQPVIMYFIEGSLDLFIDGYNINKDKLISACISLMCNKNYKVFLTRHVNETCDFLLKICLKMDNIIVNSEMKTNEIESNICDNIAKHQFKKSNQINKENIGIIMLTSIPNVSTNIATQLLEPFKNDIYLFLKEVRENESYLDNIKLRTKEGKERKLSKNVREKVMELCGETKQ